MLTQEQRAFIKEWETQRIKLSGFSSKMMRGLPVATMFSLPILLFLGIVYLFLPDWYYRISGSAGSIIAASFAVFIAILFFAYFRMHFKWEMNEQLYRELLHKQAKENAL